MSKVCIDRRFWMLCFSLILGGCSTWSSNPKKVSADYGQSVRNMVVQSTYNGYKAQHPEAYAPDGIEGQKGAVLLQRTYQSDFGSPPRVRALPQLNIGGGGSAGGQSSSP
ncbi:MAG: hypothetical protein RLZ25_2088 [Pseudomonadota bacterium]